LLLLCSSSFLSNGSQRPLLALAPISQHTLPHLVSDCAFCLPFSPLLFERFFDHIFAFKTGMPLDTSVHMVRTGGEVSSLLGKGM